MHVQDLSRKGLLKFVKILLHGISLPLRKIKRPRLKDHQNYVQRMRMRDLHPGVVYLGDGQSMQNVFYIAEDPQMQHDILRLTIIKMKLSLDATPGNVS